MSELEFTKSRYCVSLKYSTLNITQMIGLLRIVRITINQRKQTDMGFEAFRQFRRKHFAPNIFLRRWFAMGHPRPRLFSLVLLTAH